MGICGIIVVILWAIMGLLCFVQNQEQIEQLNIGAALFVFMLFIIFGPCFVIDNVLEQVLVWLGWEDDNDDGHGV
jgi:hypothetical protein